MKITIHRGINQIGGCITEIATNTSRILIDFGHNLPDGEGIGHDSLANRESIENLTDGIDAIFYTHYHGDHIELFHYVPQSIIQYIGETAQKVVLRKYEQLKLISGEEEIFATSLAKVKEMIPIKESVSVQIKDIKVTPYFVSHSAYESFMFLIEAEGKRILHTGDFRDHGYLGKGLRQILKSLLTKGKVDVLIIEGTMLSRQGERVKAEAELQVEVQSIMKRYKNVFVLCSSTDMERLATFYAANKKNNGRPIICDNYQKDILQIFSNSAGNKSPLFKFDKVYDFNKKNQKLLHYMDDRGFCMLVRPTEKFTDYYNFLKSYIKEDETVLIYSMWGMYINSECKHKKDSYLDFVNQFPAVEKVHTSGHASPQCITDICKLINPSLAIISIHGEQAEDFYSLDMAEPLKKKIRTTATFEF